LEVFSFLGHGDFGDCFEDEDEDKGASYADAETKTRQTATFMELAF
jgi:hypothetical protein